METEQPTATNSSVKGNLLQHIKKGEVCMRPRWHFLLQTALAVMGAGFLLFGLLYAASFAVHLFRASGAVNVPGFGPFGWMTFFLMLPWGLIGVAVLALFVLEMALRRFAFTYRQPLIYSFAALFLIGIIGAIVLDRMEMHRGIRMFSVQHGITPVEGWYRSMEGRRPCCVSVGSIIENGDDTVVIQENDGKVTRIFFDEGTRFPDGRVFATSDAIMLFGDSAEDGSVRARGVRLNPL